MTIFQLGWAVTCAVRPHPSGLSRRINMSLYYSVHFSGQSCRLSENFFEIFFQAAQSGFDRTGDPALMRPLCFGNVRFAHSKEEMCVNPLALFLWQHGKPFVEGFRHLALFKNFCRIKRFLHISRQYLHHDPENKMLCSGMYEPVCFFQKHIFTKEQCHLIRHFHNHVLCIKRVVIPQIDFFHG